MSLIFGKEIFYKKSLTCHRNICNGSADGEDTIMVKDNLKEFVDSLDSRKTKKETEQGTIWLNSYQEFEKISKYFDNKLVKPFHAAKLLGVTRTQINRLEREGALRTFRMAFTKEVWKTVPVHLKLVITRSDTYIWIPFQDIEAYAGKTGRNLKDVRRHYFDEFLG